MTSNTDPVLIIDLDETLLTVNSFRIWADYFIFGKFTKLAPTQHYMFSVKAAKILVERKFLGRSHSYTKNALQHLWASAKDSMALENIITSLKKRIRPGMEPVVKAIAEKRIDALLATAAAAIYAEPFARSIGFTHVIATKIGEKENRAEQKSISTLEFLAVQGWDKRPRIFFTDHLEDMPFIQNSHKLMWFGKAEEIDVIKAAAPSVEVIHCLELSSEEMARQLSL